MIKHTIDNLLTLLKGGDGKLRNMWVKPIPNVRNLKVIINGLDERLEKLGIEKSVHSHWELEKYKLKKANRYLEHQLIRLEKYSKERNSEMYWKVAELTLRKSNVWFVAHLQRNFPRWYREMPMAHLFSLKRKVEKITLDFKGEIEIYRVYIPKANSPGEWRPLGVPTPEWRVYLSMLNTVLLIWLAPTWNEQQHGYFPGKGTLTAWQEIFRRIEEKNIYEFDLKQFFPGVEISYISKVLRDNQVPTWWVYYIENLNKSKPILKGEDLADESSIREAQDIQKGILTMDQKWFKPVEEFVKANGLELLERLVREDTGGFDIYHIFEFVQLQHAIFSSFNLTQGFHGNLKGIAQGSSISPVMSVQALKPLFDQNPNTVMYADDGIIFGNPVKHHETYIEAGIEFNEQKSGWVKRNGRWLKPLKFCGLTYDGSLDKLYSSTRNGKYEEINRERLSEIVGRGKVDTYSGPKESRWYELMKDKLAGFVQAALYNGTYDLRDAELDWELKKSKGSWLASNTAKGMFKKERLKPTLYNASSLASKWLLNKLRSRKSSIIVDINKLDWGITETMAKLMNYDAKRIMHLSREKRARYYEQFGHRMLTVNAIKDLTGNPGNAENQSKEEAQVDTTPSYAEVTKQYTKRERNLLRAYRYLEDNGQKELAWQVWEEFKRNKHAKTDRKEYEEIKTPDGLLKIEKD